MDTTEQVKAWIDGTLEQTVLHTLGMRFESMEKEAVVLVTEVSERLFQPAGLVHGGVYVLMAETVASTAAALHVDASRFTVMGQEINANHLRPVRSGVLRARSKLIHQGRSSMVFGIEVTDGQGRLVSVARCTMAVRPLESLMERAEQ